MKPPTRFQEIAFNLFLVVAYWAIVYLLLCLLYWFMPTPEIFKDA